ncbi:MAG: penicillin-binding protein 2 [Gammaproteobacteria bacterium]|nr:MAG: penicillin-binding protein 2 [Gammaproteobacteria bacterium]
MARRITLKDHLRETHIFTGRVILAGILLLMLSLGIVGRLFYLQIISNEHFTTLSKNNRIRIEPIPPGRGLIYDRNGVLLAENLPSFTLELIPEQIKDIPATIGELKKIIQINPADEQRFLKSQKNKRRFESIPIRYRLNEKELARFAVNRHRFQGVEIAARLTRYYPMGELTSHAVGYVGRINEEELQNVDAVNYSATTHVGKVGIEKAYEEELHGTVGHQQVETNAQGRRLRVLESTPPIPGKNLYLSIDIRLQQVANELLRGQKGAIVAIEPDTGEVLLLASNPTYDPNLFVNGIDPVTYKGLTSSSDKPLFNRALLGLYPPGSTIKPLVGLAGLEYGRINKTDSLFCKGWYTLKNDDRKYRDWKKGGHGSVDLHDAIVESCDVYFYDLALNLGIDQFHEFFSRFGFGEPTGIDLKGERSGLLPSRQWKRANRNEPWYPGETLITGIGQGFTLVTPLQLATMTTAIANKGIRLIPRMLRSIQDPLSQKNTEPGIRRDTPVLLKQPENWDTIIKAMTDVVHGPKGTARAIGRNAPYRIAGKTGTAQIYEIKQDETYEKEKVKKTLRDHALFISFAPVDKPKIAVAVVVENAGSGSAVAAPMARTIMDTYLIKK